MKAKIVSRPGEPGNPFTPPAADPRFAGGPPRAAGAEAAPAAPTLDQLGPGASLVEVAAALGIKPDAEGMPTMEAVPEAPGAPAAPPPVEVGTDVAWSDPAFAQRPEGVPAKFKNMADFVASYTVLERALHRRGELRVKGPDGAPPAAGADGKPAEGAPPAAGTMAEVFSDEAMSKYAQEFQANGALTEATLLSLEAKGIPRTVVNRFIENEVRSAKNEEAALLAEHGMDESTFTAMAEWAAGGGMPKSALDAVDAALQAADRGQQSLGLAYLRDAYQRAHQTAKPRLAGQSAGGPGAPAAAITSQRSVADAVGDPRYGHDQAYTAEVLARIAAGLRQ